jgi:hypothetical protein
MTTLNKLHLIRWLERREPITVTGAILEPKTPIGFVDFNSPRGCVALYFPADLEFYRYLYRTYKFVFTTSI